MSRPIGSPASSAVCWPRNTREALQAGLADGVDFRIAGDDIGEVGFDRGLGGEGIVAASQACERLERRARCAMPVMRSVRQGKRGEDRAPRRGGAAAAGGCRPRARTPRARRSAAARAPPGTSVRADRRLAQAIGFDARIERREVERLEPVGGQQRVHGKEPVRRSVKSRRVIGLGAAGVVRPAPAARSAAAGRTRRSR